MSEDLGYRGLLIFILHIQSDTHFFYHKFKQLLEFSLFLLFPLSQTVTH